MIELLVADNQAVSNMGLTHKQIADALTAAMELAEKSEKVVRESMFESKQFSYRGQQYLYTRYQTKGFQFSPFNDGTMTTYHVEFRSMATGKTILVSGLMPEMISRYGFYEGNEVEYRLDPRVLADFFKLR